MERGLSHAMRAWRVLLTSVVVHVVALAAFAYWWRGTTAAVATVPLASPPIENLAGATAAATSRVGGDRRGARARAGRGRRCRRRPGPHVHHTGACTRSAYRGDRVPACVPARVHECGRRARDRRCGLRRSGRARSRPGARSRHVARDARPRAAPRRRPARAHRRAARPCRHAADPVGPDRQRAGWPRGHPRRGHRGRDRARRYRALSRQARRRCPRRHQPASRRRQPPRRRPGDRGLGGGPRGRQALRAHPGSTRAPPGGPGCVLDLGRCDVRRPRGARVREGDAQARPRCRHGHAVRPQRQARHHRLPDAQARRRPVLVAQAQAARRHPARARRAAARVSAGTARARVAAHAGQPRAVVGRDSGPRRAQGRAVRAVGRVRRGGRSDR